MSEYFVYVYRIEMYQIYLNISCTRIEKKRIVYQYYFIYVYGSNLCNVPFACTRTVSLTLSLSLYFSLLVSCALSLSLSLSLFLSLSLSLSFSLSVLLLALFPPRSLVQHDGNITCPPLGIVVTSPPSRPASPVSHERFFASASSLAVWWYDEIFIRGSYSEGRATQQWRRIIRRRQALRGKLYYMHFFALELSISMYVCLYIEVS